MADAMEILEQVSVMAPLGMRFRDAATNAMVDDGLSVVAYPSDNPARRTTAFTNRKGVFVFRDLPGLRAAENSAGDSMFWASLAKKKSFLIEVKDGLRRFQSFLLNIDLPVKGLYRWELDVSSSPPAPEAPVPLFSASSRRAPAGMAVVRADLWNPHTDEPAAWALVEASVSGKVLGRCFADEKGRILLIFAYPEPKETSSTSPISSPVSGHRKSLVDQSWPLDLQAFYTPIKPVPEIPDLAEVFRQAPAHLWSSLSPAIELGQQNLEFGKELILKSVSESLLWITPEPSPI